MSEVETTAKDFEKFDKYYSYLLGGLRGLSNGELEENGENDGRTVVESFAKQFAKINNPASQIYQDIAEYGEWEVKQSVTETAPKMNEYRPPSVCWTELVEADKRLRNPEDGIYYFLRDAGISDKNIDYLHQEYQEQIEPFISQVNLQE